MRPKYYCLTKKGAHAACWQRALIMMMISQYTAGGPNEREKKRLKRVVRSETDHLVTKGS